MKLANVLSLVNQFEKSKFINAIDRICTDAKEKDKKLAEHVNKLDVQIKNASSNDIVQLFRLVLPYFVKSAKEQLAMLGAQATLLTNILSRDGNCIASIDWIETLYSKEWAAINRRAGELYLEKESIDDGEKFTNGKRLGIYFSCLDVAAWNYKWASLIYWSNMGQNYSLLRNHPGQLYLILGQN